MHGSTHYRTMCDTNALPNMHHGHCQPHYNIIEIPHAFSWKFYSREPTHKWNWHYIDIKLWLSVWWSIIWGGGGGGGGNIMIPKGLINSIGGRWARWTASTAMVILRKTTFQGKCRWHTWKIMSPENTHLNILTLQVPVPCTYTGHTYIGHHFVCWCPSIATSRPI